MVILIYLFNLEIIVVNVHVIVFVLDDLRFVMGTTTNRFLGKSAWILTTSPSRIEFWRINLESGFKISRLNDLVSGRAPY